MKKILISLGLLALVGGASVGAYFFFGSATVKDGALPKNPEAEFSERLEKSIYAWDGILKEDLPSKELLQKNESVFSVSGNADLQHIIGGKLDFSFQANGKIDRTNTENPVMELIADIFLDMKENPLFTMKVDMQGVVKFVEKTLFFSLQKSEVSIPDPSYVAAFNALKGKWYGMTSEELKTTSEGNLSFEQFFGNDAWISFWNLWEEMKKDPKAIFVFQKSLPAENGMYLFEVKVQEAFLQKAMEAFIPKSILDVMPETEKNTIMESLKKISETPMILGFDPNNAEYILQRFEAKDPSTGEKWGMHEFLFTKQLTKAEFFLNKGFSVKGEAKEENGKTLLSFSQKKEEKTQVFASGEKTPSSFLLDIFDPSKEESVKSIHLEATKENEMWKGTIALTEYANILVSFEDVLLGIKKSSGKILVKQKAETEEKTLATINLSGEMKPLEKLEVKKPENFEPMKNAMDAFTPKKQETTPIEKGEKTETSQVKTNEN